MVFPLSPLVGHLPAAAHTGDGDPWRLYFFDSKPIPLCKPIRHGRVRLLREDGAYFGKNSYGFFLLGHRWGPKYFLTRYSSWDAPAGPLSLAYPFPFGTLANVFLRFS